MPRVKKQITQENNEETSAPESSGRRVLRSRLPPVASAPEPASPAKRSRTQVKKTQKVISTQEPEKISTKPTARKVNKKTSDKDKHIDEHDHDDEDEDEADAVASRTTSQQKNDQSDNKKTKVKLSKNASEPTSGKTSRQRSRKDKNNDEQTPQIVEEETKSAKISKAASTKAITSRGRKTRKEATSPLNKQSDNKQNDNLHIEKPEEVSEPKGRGRPTKKPLESVVTKAKANVGKTTKPIQVGTSSKDRGEKDITGDDLSDNLEKSHKEVAPLKAPGKNVKAISKTEEAPPPLKISQAKESKVQAKRGKKAILNEEKKLEAHSETKGAPEVVSKPVRGRKPKATVERDQKSGDKLKEKSEDNSKEKSEDNSKEKSKDNSKEKSEDNSKEKSKDNPKEKLEDKSKEKLDDKSEEKLKDKSKVRSEQKPEPKEESKSKEEPKPKARGRKAQKANPEIKPTHQNVTKEATKRKAMAVTDLEPPVSRVADETVVIRKADSPIVDVTLPLQDTEVLETIEMLVNETVISQSSSFENDESLEIITEKQPDRKKRNAMDASLDLDDDSFDTTKRLKIEDYSRLITVGTSAIACELGPQQKLFNGEKIRPTMPRLVGYPGENGIKMIASGAYHNIFIDNNDRLRSFGCNDDGSLGRDTVTIPDDYCGSDDEYEERACLFPGFVECENLKFRKISAGDMLSVGLEDNGDVYVFGNIKDESDKLGLFPDSPRLMIKDDDGTLRSTSNFEPCKIPKKLVLPSDKAIDIASGSHHVVILSKNGVVYTFGEGSKGQLGRIAAKDLEDIKNRRSLFLTPHMVNFKKLEPSEKIIKVFAAHWSSFAITNHGNLYAWGLNNYNQLGFETVTPIFLPSKPEYPYLFELLPVKVNLSFKVDQVAGGQQHLLLLDNLGNVYACGNGLYGRLGLSSISTNALVDPISKPKMIESERFHNQKIQSIACGDFYSLALTTSGTVYAWGQACGAIGTAEDANDVFRPKKYSGAVIDSYTIVQISAGSQFAAFIGERR